MTNSSSSNTKDAYHVCTCGGATRWWCLRESLRESLREMAYETHLLLQSARGYHRQHLVPSTLLCVLYYIIVAPLFGLLSHSTLLFSHASTQAAKNPDSPSRSQPDWIWKGLGSSVLFQGLGFIFNLRARDGYSETADK